MCLHSSSNHCFAVGNLPLLAAAKCYTARKSACRRLGNEFDRHHGIHGAPLSNYQGMTCSEVYRLGSHSLYFWWRWTPGRILRMLLEGGSNRHSGGCMITVGAGLGTRMFVSSGEEAQSLQRHRLQQRRSREYIPSVQERAALRRAYNPSKARPYQPLMNRLSVSRTTA